MFAFDIAIDFERTWNFEQPKQINEISKLKTYSSLAKEKARRN